MASVDTVVRQNDSVDSLRGKLLVASPAITDPNFRRAVVLIAEHSGDGAMGVVLDRLSEATVGEVVGGLSWLAGDDAEVYVGGPVATTSVTVLAEFRDPARAALLIEDDLGFIPAETEDEAGLAEAVARVVLCMVWRL
jgi:putative transcriptional regulator